MTIRINRSGTARRRATEVFDFLADVRTELQWDPDTVAVTKLTDGPVRRGTRFRDVNKMTGVAIEAIWETVEYDRPSRLTRWTRNEKMEMKASYAVEPVAESARVILDLEIRLLGWRRLLEPVMRLLIARYAEVSERRLISALESGATGPPA